MVALAGLPEFAALCRQPAQFWQCLTGFASRDGRVQLIGYQKIGVFRHLERSCCDHAAPQFSCHRAQHLPGVTKVERHLFANIVVLRCQPPPITELPVLEPGQELRYLGKLLVTDGLCLDLLVLRVVVLVLNHRLDGSKQCRRVFHLGWLDKIHTVALVSIGVEIPIDALHHRCCVRMLAQCRHQELGRRDDHEVSQLLAGPNQFGDLEQVCIGLHRL